MGICQSHNCGVPYQDVYYLHQRRIPDYDPPVALFISAHVHVAPGVIVELRLGGAPAGKGSGQSGKGKPDKADSKSDKGNAKKSGED